MKDDLPIFFKKLFTLFESYITNNGNKPVINYIPPHEMKLKLLQVLSSEGRSLEELLPYIEFYLEHAVNSGHPQFFNQLFAGRNTAGMVGDWLATLTNTSMYTYAMAPVATLLEQSMIEKLNTYVGYKTYDGVFTPGGSYANTMAMLCARNEIAPHIKHQGFMSQKPLVAYISEVAHYSFLKAANLVGIGIDNVKKIPVNDQFEMDPDALDREIQHTISEGKTPFFVAATAGTTVWGSVDPIEKIHTITKKYNLWFHVDGAHGGAMILSKQHKHKLAGLEHSDSFTWDAHKLIGVPLVCSILLVNRPRTFLTQIADNDDGGYLFHNNETEDESDSFDLGKKSFQCGRKVDVLKLWLSWAHYGDKGYESRINHCIHLTNHAAKIIENHPQLSLYTPQQYVNICFQYIPNDKNIDINSFNERLRDTLYKKGISMVNQAKQNENIFIRLITVNPDNSTYDIEHFFDNVLKIGAELERG